MLKSGPRFSPSLILVIKAQYKQRQLSLNLNVTYNKRSECWATQGFSLQVSWLCVYELQKLQKICGHWRYEIIDQVANTLLCLLPQVYHFLRWNTDILHEKMCCLLSSACKKSIRISSPLELSLATICLNKFFSPSLLCFPKQLMQPFFFLLCPSNVFPESAVVTGLI